MGPEIFSVPKAVVGMVHVAALPGTPRSSDGIDAIIERAVREAKLLVDAGFDALIVENMHDVPYLKREVGPEIIASMAVIAGAVRRAVKAPLGVQILAGANRAAVAVAQASGAGFVRAEGFVYSAVADEGLLETADAGPLLRFRKAIGAERVKILADVKKKHSAHAITADVDIAEAARAAEFFGADGVIVTGVATARPTDVNDLRQVRVATKLPLAVGSGTRPENIREMFEYADAVIIGAWYKERGDWRNAPDPARVDEIIKAAERVRL
jgi:membrane complex biogenesis BtpA family protein